MGEGFRGWLRRHVRHSAPIGDLARDLAADPCGQSRLYASIRRHLIEVHHADECALLTLDEAWAAYCEDGRVIEAGAGQGSPCQQTQEKP